MTDPACEQLRALLATSERERASLQETLHDVLSFQRLAETVGEASDLASLVDVLAQTLGRVVPWLAATIRIGDERGLTREVFACGMVPRAVERFAELEEEALVRWAMDSQRPTLIPPMDGPAGTGWILVPLVVQHRVVGLAGIIPAISTSEVTSHQMDMLRFIAAQAAAAMDNLGHMEAVQRNWAELHSLYEVAATLGRSLEVEHVFDTVRQAIESRYTPLVVGLAFIEPQGGATRIFATGLEPEACRVLLDLGLQASSMVTVAQELSHGEELVRLGARVALVVPLAAGGIHLGSLLVAHADREFGRSLGVCEWFEAVSRLLSSSLENARLYEQVLATTRHLAELQSRMIQAGRLAGIGQLAGGIAHEINNPLQVILGRVQILQMKCQDQPKLLSDLSRMETETMRIAQIVRGMQEFARQEGGEVAHRPVAMSQIVQSVLELVAFRLKRHRIEVVRTGSAISPVVSGDQDELKHLVLNLCLNAIQAMPKGGFLTIDLASRDGQVVLEMADTGPGIPAEDIERIFDPFFTRRPHGTGMGLAIGYSIAQRHGGSVHAVPGLASGAILRVLLPVLTSAPIVYPAGIASD